MNQCSSSAPLAANFAPTNCSAAPPDHTPSTLVALFRTHQLLGISRHDAPFRHGRQLQRRRSKRTNNHLMIITSQSNKNTHRRFCASSTRRRVLNESQPFPYKYVTFFFSYSALVLYHPSRQRDLVRRRIIAGFLVDPSFVTGSISASTRHLQAISWTCRVCGSHSASQTGPQRIIIIIIRVDQFQAAEFKKKNECKTSRLPRGISWQSSERQRIRVPGTNGLEFRKMSVLSAAGFVPVRVKALKRYVQVSRDE